MRKTLLFFSFAFAFLTAIKSQDGHYSQIFQSPLNLNPAFTGLSNAKFRVGGTYRSQWKAVNTPYENFNFYFDKINEKFSFGLLIDQNNAGIEGIKSTNILISFSYKKPLKEGNNWLSFGSQVGFIQQRFDLSKLTFDNQYNPEKGFDASLESGENFRRTSILLPDFNVGINWRFSKQAGTPVHGDIGVSFAHVNTPNSSFLNENIHIPLKTIFYLRPQVDLNSKLGLEPFVIFSKQGPADEILLGLNAVFNLEKSKFKVGVGNRTKDALIFMTSFYYKNIEFGFSYDAHYQDFGNSNNASSLEFSMTYLFGLKTQSNEDEKLKQDSKKSVKGQKESDAPKIKTIDDDNDGIPNELDLCPYEAGIAKLKGCNDKDADGIFDNEDACPSLPGKQENYGCPLKNKNIDSDGDGVKDLYDDCIYLSGLAYLNGCPDSDEDGISDYEDECPYLKGTPETFGCPSADNKKSGYQKSNDFMEFESNSSNIKSQYFPFLDRLAFQIKNNQQLKIVIEGHTDQEGNHLYNYHLSQQRAHNVRNYFYEKGVPIERVEMHFFGETKPKIDRNTEFAKARNRRVELIVFSK